MSMEFVFVGDKFIRLFHLLLVLCDFFNFVDECYCLWQFGRYIYSIVRLPFPCFRYESGSHDCQSLTNFLNG